MGRDLLYGVWARFAEGHGLRFAVRCRCGGCVAKICCFSL